MIGSIMKKYLVIVIFLIQALEGIIAVNQVFGRYGSVKIDISGSVSPSLDQRWGSSWPEGIRLSNNIQSSTIPASAASSTSATVTATLPRVIQYQNATGYPYATIQEKQMKARKIFHKPRTFSWNTDDEMVITCKLSEAATNPSCTRIAPPASWLTITDATVISNIPDSDSGTVEIQVSKYRVENNLVHLRGIGMSREDIFRMLDKGPWILAFDISSSVNKLVQDLQSCLELNQTDCKHIITHCPYLLAQYSRYKGRDVCATVSALKDIFYSDGNSLTEDIMRFPSVLATPPERIRGWMTLLQQYGIAREPRLFGKMIRRSPFMFYRDPPYPFEFNEKKIRYSSPSTSSSSSSSLDSTMSSSLVVYEALSVLNLLASYQIPDLDKVIRSQPAILMTDEKEIQQRINFFLSLFSMTSPSSKTTATNMDSKSSKTYQQDDIDSMDSEISDITATDMFGQTSVAWTTRTGVADMIGEIEIETEALATFHDLLHSYPAALSIEYKQMRSMGNALRASGLSRTEVVYVIKSFPIILQKSSEIIQSLFFFLKSYCGFRKSDIVPFLTKFPALLSTNIETLKPKVDYLFQSLNGTPAMLRKYPQLLSHDLDDYIRPRMEFLRAFDQDPTALGLHFVMKASPSDLASVAGVSLEDYKKFCSSFTANHRKWKKTVNPKQSSAVSK